MKTIRLTALRGSHPLQTLAAFGLLRVLHDRTEIGDLRLAWEPEGNVAVLHVPDSVTRQSLVDAVVAAMDGRNSAAYFNLADDIKMPPADYRQFCREVLEAENTPPQQQPEAAGFLAAFASPLITDRAGKNVKPTAFHMTAGQQKFLKSCRELAESLCPERNLSKQEAKRDREEIRSTIAAEIHGAFERALWGPWLTQDTFHSLGFDPAAEALYALSDKAPTKVKPVSERAAVWLAIEALPLFPCRPQITSRGRQVLHTRCFEPGRSTPGWFRWPLWSPGLTLPALRSLLGIRHIVAGDANDSERNSTLEPQGVHAIYQSDCLRDSNGRGTFRHASPVFLQPRLAPT